MVYHRFHYSKIVQISSGQGPAECEWVVSKLTKHFCSVLDKRNIIYEIIDSVDGYNDGDFFSVTLKISADNLDSIISEYEGTIQYVGKSMYRPTHKRKNWFVKMSFFDISKSVVFDESKIEFQTMRSSGAGGQHVNKTESAVRAIYRDLDISVVVSDTRNQHQNKKLAIERLRDIAKSLDNNISNKQTEKEWLNHRELERGNAIKKFSTEKFKEI